MCPTPKYYCFHPGTLCKWECKWANWIHCLKQPGDWTRRTHPTQLLDVSIIPTKLSDVSKNSSSREKLVLKLRCLNHTKYQYVTDPKHWVVATQINMESVRRPFCYTRSRISKGWEALTWKGNVSRIFSRKFVKMNKSCKSYDVFVNNANLTLLTLLYKLFIEVS